MKAATFSWIAYALIGYGEQPGKLLIPYWFVLAFWGWLYFELASHAWSFLPPYKPHGLTAFQALKLSVSTFRGDPGFPPDLLQQPFIGSVLPVLGAAETVIGSLILLAMTLLWTRRLFGNETPVVEGGQMARRRRLATIVRRQSKPEILPQTPAQDTS